MTTSLLFISSFSVQQFYC